METHSFLPPEVPVQPLETSLLRGTDTVNSRRIPFDDVFEQLTNDSLKIVTEEYRRSHEPRLKASCPAITPAVILNGTGKKQSDIVAFTGLTMCDFDHVPTGELDLLLDLARTDPHTFLVYTTLSGEGIRILCKYSDREYSTEKYKKHFLRANFYYAQLLGLPYDRACSNPNRLSFLAYDPAACYQPNAVPFEDEKPFADDEPFADDKPFADAEPL